MSISAVSQSSDAQVVATDSSCNPSAIASSGGSVSSSTLKSPSFDTFSPFPRYSAFAAVLAQRQSENSADKLEAAQNADEVRLAAEANLKRKQPGNFNTANSDVSVAPPKRAKVSEIFNNNEEIRCVMRLPPSAKSGLCQQRARESLFFNTEQQKQKQQQPRFNSRFPLPEKPRQKRAVIQDMVRPLKKWLLRHRHNPYPTKAEKVQLALGSNMTLVQVSNWFANARRRLKNVVQENHCSWSKRLRMYNQYVQGNAELLSISSGDSIWNSDEEDANNATSQKNLGSRIDDAVASAERTSPEPDENRDSAQYKKSMMQRYLNDSVEAASATSAAKIATSTKHSELGSTEPTSQYSSATTLKMPKTSSSALSICLSTPSSILPLATAVPKFSWPPLQPPPPQPGMLPWLPVPPFLHYLQLSGMSQWMPPPPPGMLQIHPTAHPPLPFQYSLPEYAKFCDNRFTLNPNGAGEKR